MGDFDTARDHCRAALTLHRHHHNPAGEAQTLGNLGYIVHNTGRYHQALEYYRQSVDLLRQSGDTYLEALAHDWTGQTHAALGQHEQAREAWQEALELYREQGRDTDAQRIQQQLDDLDGPAQPYGGAVSDLPKTFDEAFLAVERSVWLRDVFPTVLDVDLLPEVEPFSFVPVSGLEEIASALRVGPGGLLVDVACGRGGPGMWVARHVGAALCGVDSSPVAVAAASRRRDAFGLESRGRFVVGDLSDTGLHDGEADAVMCVDAFQFAGDRDVAARELRRVLRPGGRLVLTCWEARTRGDADVAERFATLRCGDVLRDVGFADVDVSERPVWEQHRRAVYEAALAAGPSDDPGLTLMQDEARTALTEMRLIKRVIAVATR